MRFSPQRKYSGTSDLNKGHLCIRDTFDAPTYMHNIAFLEDNLSIMDVMICPNVSII